MIKIIPPGSYNFDVPQVSLIDMHSRGIDSGWLVKHAAVMTREISELRPEAGHSYLHVISLGSQEWLGHNRNGDGFNETKCAFELPNPKPGVDRSQVLGGGLIEFHPTFSKYAHVFKHHKNDDPKKSIGSIKAAAYNLDMHRGELIIKVPHNNEWNDHLQKVASGGQIPFSMACKVANDMCSECGNRAKTRGEYCDHLKNYMGDLTKEGNSIFAINDRPQFFDISLVTRPADRIAYSLRKVAGEQVIGGAALAEELGLEEHELSDYLMPKLAGKMVKKAVFERKLATAKKMADIEKHLDAIGQKPGKEDLKRLVGAAPKKKQIDDKAVETAKHASLGGVFKIFNDHKIQLPIDSFFRLVASDRFDEVAPYLSKASEYLPHIYGILSGMDKLAEVASDRSYDGENEYNYLSGTLHDYAEGMTGSHSLGYEPMEFRLRSSIFGDNIPEVREGIKTAGLNDPAMKMAVEYAKYQVGFVSGLGCDLERTISVLQNRI